MTNIDSQSEINMKHVVEDLIIEFIKIAHISRDEIEYDILPAPHEPYGLPKNKIAVYVFKTPNYYLKIGKVGSKSKARFNSHHYTPKGCKSSLYNSILNNKSVVKEIIKREPNIKEIAFDDANLQKWIKENTTRINFFLSKDCDRFLLNLLEAFLQYKSKPVFEGKDIKNVI